VCQSTKAKWKGVRHGWANAFTILNSLHHCLVCAARHFDVMEKIEKRGRRRIRTAEYWREYYTRKQREWRAAHPGWKKRRKQKDRET